MHWHQLLLSDAGEYHCIIEGACAQIPGTNWTSEHLCDHLGTAFALNCLLSMVSICHYWLDAGHTPRHMPHLQCLPAQTTRLWLSPQFEFPLCNRKMPTWCMQRRHPSKHRLATRCSAMCVASMVSTLPSASRHHHFLRIRTIPIFELSVASSFLEQGPGRCCVDRALSSY